MGGVRNSAISFAQWVCVTNVVVVVVAGFGIKITRLLACSTVWESTVLLTDYLWQNIHFTDMITGLGYKHITIINDASRVIS
jgi:hypothetical protein